MRGVVLELGFLLLCVAGVLGVGVSCWNLDGEGEKKEDMEGEREEHT